MNLPPYNLFPVIKTERLSLREIKPADVNTIIEISYYNSIQAGSEEEAQEMLNKINTDYLKGSSIHWGIEEISTGRITGTIGFYRGFDHGIGELGCVLLPSYRGKGIMTEAMSSAVIFGFNTAGLNRIKAVTSIQNIKALKLLDRLRFMKTLKPQNDNVEYELTINKFMNSSL